MTFFFLIFSLFLLWPLTPSWPWLLFDFLTFLLLFSFDPIPIPFFPQSSVNLHFLRLLSLPFFLLPYLSHILFHFHPLTLPLYSLHFYFPVIYPLLFLLSPISHCNSPLNLWPLGEFMTIFLSPSLCFVFLDITCSPTTIYELTKYWVVIFSVCFCLGLQFLCASARSSPFANFFVIFWASSNKRTVHVVYGNHFRITTEAQSVRSGV